MVMAAVMLFMIIIVIMAVALMILVMIVMVAAMMLMPVFIIVIMMMTAAVVLSILVMVMVVTAVMLLGGAAAVRMGMTVLLFLSSSLAYILDYHHEIKSLACKRMIAVNNYSIFLNLLDNHRNRSVIGIGLKDIAHSDREITEHTAIDLLQHGFVIFTI